MSDTGSDGTHPVSVADVAAFDLFTDSDPEDVVEFLVRFDPVIFSAGTTVLAAGDPGTFFLLLRRGEVTVTIPEDSGAHNPITLRPGDIVGELSILRGSPRAATVVATTNVHALRGDRDTFAALLALPGVSSRLRRTAAGRLAANAEPVELDLRDGTPIRLRPVLPTDWDNLQKALEHVSLEFFRHRFFSGGRPTDHILHYLIDIDYTNHFAWAAFVTGTHGEDAIASARYICNHDDPGSAEIALGVIDEYQGRGLGALLIGALAAAAPTVGIDRFYAMTNADNAAMRHLWSRFGARWKPVEPGVVGGEVRVQQLDQVLAVDEHDALAQIAASIIGTAHRSAV